eukprot:TRINITY_DN5886_c0_g1_i1.p1 TRINITY_DN5886_c0_g1~~TRINITY_DN5886_c0_g1_i1.p1  ORF type:complete len:388 (+),score=90.58 TRINITY_DN5886_c0_g1_i1:106-1269(+)
MPRLPMKLLGGNSNPGLWAKVAEHLQVPLAETEIQQFANSETGVNVHETVRQTDVYIMQSGCGDVNPNTATMELCILAQACSNASAERVTAVLPYFPYSKQSKQKKRGAIAAKLVADLLQVAGFTHILTFDLHHMQMQGFFGLPVDNVKCSPLLLDYIRDQIPDNEDCVIAAKNAGASKRAALIAKRRQAEYAMIFGEHTKFAETLAEERWGGDGSDEAARTEAKGAVDLDLEEVEEGLDDGCQGDGVIGDVTGRDVIIVDDLIDGADSFIRAAEMFRANGCDKVYIVATHGLLSGDAPQKLQDCAAIERVAVTNTIPQEEHQKQCPKLDVIDCSEVVAEAIRRVHFDESLYAMYSPSLPAAMAVPRKRGARSRTVSSRDPDAMHEA